MVCGGWKIKTKEQQRRRRFPTDGVRSAGLRGLGQLPHLTDEETHVEWMGAMFKVRCLVWGEANELSRRSGQEFAQGLAHLWTQYHTGSLRLLCAGIFFKHKGRGEERLLAQAGGTPRDEIWFLTARHSVRKLAQETKEMLFTAYLWHCYK